MSYLSQLAEDIRAQVPQTLLPDEDNDRLFLIYAVLLLAKGSRVEAKDVHNAWVAWMVSRGEQHPSMVEFDRLPDAVKREDDPFVAAIRQVAAFHNM
jgi:hypothetical protein